MACTCLRQSQVSGSGLGMACFRWDALEIAVLPDMPPGKRERCAAGAKCIFSDQHSEGRRFVEATGAHIRAAPSRLAAVLRRSHLQSWQAFIRSIHFQVLSVCNAKTFASTVERQYVSLYQATSASGYNRLPSAPHRSRAFWARRRLLAQRT